MLFISREFRPHLHKVGNPVIRPVGKRAIDIIGLDDFGEVAALDQCLTRDRNLTRCRAGLRAQIGGTRNGLSVRQKAGHIRKEQLPVKRHPTHFPTPRHQQDHAGKSSESCHG